MAKKLNERGGNAELIIYDDLQTNVAHDVWTRTFTDVKTYEWLLQHKRS
jgi:hypothetical protein